MIFTDLRNDGAERFADLLPGDIFEVVNGDNDNFYIRITPVDGKSFTANAVNLETGESVYFADRNVTRLTNVELIINNNIS